MFCGILFDANNVTGANSELFGAFDGFVQQNVDYLQLRSHTTNSRAIATTSRALIVL
jgi:hypothetical protein